MNPLREIQKLAHQFNEAEAVWRAFEEKRALRRLLRAESPLPEETLDWLDWQAAEAESCAVRAIGFLV